MNTKIVNLNYYTLLKCLLIIVLGLQLAACSSNKTKPTSDSASSASKPAIGSKRGGYYLDDGPGDNPPANIDAIPDAVPRVETPLDRANRPYVALGKSYTPSTIYKPYKARGVASWYGKRYHGQKTSSGEVYDMYAMTGAHTTLTLPSYAKVTNPANGRSVIVRINDRGPFHSERLIDLSYAAAYKLRLQNGGSGIVDVEAINLSTNTGSAKPISELAKPAFVAANNLPSSTSGLTTPISTPYAEMAKGSYVQVGAFKFKENAELLREKLIRQNLTENTATESWYNAGLYRVRLGTYPSRQDAEKAAAKIRQALSTSAIVINQP
ncbi:MAG: septal ring lytic transglycosylase RlpA family protein [Methylophilaceae bacterium]